MKITDVNEAIKRLAKSKLGLRQNADMTFVILSTDGETIKSGEPGYIPEMVDGYYTVGNFCFNEENEYTFGYYSSEDKCREACRYMNFKRFSESTGLGKGLKTIETAKGEYYTHPPTYKAAGVMFETVTGEKLGPYKCKVPIEPIFTIQELEKYSAWYHNFLNLCGLPGNNKQSIGKPYTNEKLKEMMKDVKPSNSDAINAMQDQVKQCFVPKPKVYRIEPIHGKGKATITGDKLCFYAGSTEIWYKGYLVATVGPDFIISETELK